MNFVIGYGVVGKTTFKLVKGDYFYDPAYENHPKFREIEDMARYSDCEKESNRDVYYICIPTPATKSGHDIKQLKETIHQIVITAKAPIIVIRSTITPGTTRILHQIFGTTDIMFMPEFLNERTALEDTLDPELIVLGAVDQVLAYDVLNEIYDFNFDHVDKQPMVTDPTTAEVIKCGMNAFFGMKVVLGNILRDITVTKGGFYEDVVSALEGHKWGSVNGWDPFHGGYRGYGGKCLPKDIEALSSLDKTGFLKKMQEVNKEYNEIKL